MIIFRVLTGLPNGDRDVVFAVASTKEEAETLATAKRNENASLANTVYWEEYLEDETQLVSVESKGEFFMQMATVVYYQNMTRPGNPVDIVCVFTDANPGTGKISTAIDYHMAFRRMSGETPMRDEYHVRSGAMDLPSTWGPFHHGA